MEAPGIRFAGDKACMMSVFKNKKEGALLIYEAVPVGIGNETDWSKINKEKPDFLIIFESVESAKGVRTWLDALIKMFEEVSDVKD